MDKPDKDGDKESIEEILSDLNSLLNRMPAILSDIKMPETRPVDFSRIRREAEEQPAPPAPARGDETIRLEPEEMAGIAASAHVLPDPEPEPSPDLSGEEYNFEFAPEPRPAAAPAPEPVAAPAQGPAGTPEDSFEQSGDFGVPDVDALLRLSVSGEDAIKPAEEKKDQGGAMEEKHQDDQERPAEVMPGSLPAGEAVPGQPAEESLPSQEQPAERPAGEELTPVQEPPAFEATVKMDSPFEFPEQPAERPAGEELTPVQEPPAFEATVKMDSPFEFPEPAAEQPAAPAQAAGAEEALPSGDDLKAFESAFVIPGTDNPPEPGIQAAEPPAPEATEPPFPAPEPAEEPAPAVREDAAPAAGIRAEGISLEPQFPMPDEQPAPSAEQPAAVEEPQPGAGEPQLTVGEEPRLTVGEEPQLTVGEPQLSVGSPDLQPGGLSLEPRSDTPFESPIEAVTGAASPGESAEEKTVVFGPGQMSGTPGGEETLVYQGGDPSATSRMKAEASLPELAAMEPPAAVDKSRVKTLAFMYAAGEEKFCADVLATLDAICLKSESRPMFIKRAFVKPCGDDMRGAMAQQMVSDAGAAGLICVGSVSQEALYDIENAFGSSGSFFRHFSQDSFGLTSALDSVLDLILKP
jgi:hypothetical protein